MTKRILIALFAMSSFLAGVGFGSAQASAYPSLVCAGGDIAAGDYQAIRVTGSCQLTGGAVTVHGDLRLDPGSILNGITPTELTVQGSVYVGTGAALGLGCSPEAGCDVTTNDRILGNLVATQPLALILHSDFVGGNLVSIGGGGGVNCTTPLLGGPAYSTFEDLTVGGDILVANLRSCWVGFFRNHVGRNLLVLNNVLADPDASEVTDNVVHTLLDCERNSPAAQIGDSGGGPNTAALKFGQCAGL